MTDFPTTGRTCPARFTHRERREIVVQNKPLGFLPTSIAVQLLRLISGSERHQGDRLRFATLKECRTVTPRKQSNLRTQIADLIQSTTVTTRLLVENRNPEGFLLQIVECLAHFKFRGLRKLRHNRHADFFLQSGDRFLTHHFALIVNRRFNAVTRHRISHFHELVFYREKSDLALRLTHSGSEINLSRNQLSRFTMRKMEGFDKVRLGQLIRRSFNHDHLVLCPDIHEVEITATHFLMRRVSHKHPLDTAHSNRRHWTSKGDVADHQCRTGAVDEKHVRIIHAIRTKKDPNDLRVIKIALGKERAKRTIRHPASKDFLLRRTTLPLEISAGELAHSGGFFAVVNGQRKPVLALFNRRRGDCRNHDDGVASLDGYGAVREFRELAGFNGDGGGSDLSRDVLNTHITAFGVESGTVGRVPISDLNWARSPLVQCGQRKIFPAEICNRENCTLVRCRSILVRKPLSGMPSGKG